MLCPIQEGQNFGADVTRLIMEKIMSKMRYFIIKTIDFIRSGIKNLYNRLLTTRMTILLVKNKGEEYILHKKGCQQSKIHTVKQTPSIVHVIYHFARRN